MKMRMVLPLMVAIIAGLGFMVILQNMLEEKNKRGQEKKEVVVLVSTQELLPAVAIDEKMIVEKRFPEDRVPIGAFTDKQKLLGRVPLIKINPNTPVTDNLLTPVGVAQGPDSQIPKGYRLFPITLDSATISSGIIMPGSVVDVVAEVDVPTRSGKSVKKSGTILQKVKVFQLGGYTTREALEAARATTTLKASELNTASLLLTPKEVEVAHGHSKARLTLSLRSGMDETDVPLEDFRSELAAAEEPAGIQLPTTPPPLPTTKTVVEASKAEPLKRFTTWEIRGTVAEQVTYVFVNGYWMRETDIRGGGTAADYVLPSTTPDSQQVATQVTTQPAAEAGEVAQSQPEENQQNSADEESAAGESEEAPTEG
ncbi:MAG: hypothetical protein HJJLKODD_01006 [Phycisphaerae bacterium]|nr:hypothetical protein [Phycisphaerae bacterium]